MLLAAIESLNRNLRRDTSSGLCCGSSSSGLGGSGGNAVVLMVAAPVVTIHAHAPTSRRLEALLRLPEMPSQLLPHSTGDAIPATQRSRLRPHPTSDGPGYRTSSQAFPAPPK